MYSALAAFVAFLLLRYVHSAWQPGWAVGCGVLAGSIIRRAVEPNYRSFPAFLRRPLAVAVVLTGTIVAVWATFAAGGYGWFYVVARWREAVTLPVIAVSLGVGAAGVIYTHARLQREVEHRERLEEDLRLAHGIQQSLLRSEFPQTTWVDAAAFNVPSRDVGGDYYEVFDRDTGELEFAIGDVSGKGVPAALLMSSLQSAFLGASTPDQDLARVCSRINRFLFERTAPERYATFFVGRLAAGADLEFVNAGHNPPMLLRGRECQRLMGGGMPLGLFGDAPYEVETVGLMPGDLVLCYTDGVTEALSPDDEEFGERRLLDVACENDGADAAALVEAIRVAVETHTRGAPQHDDLTLLAVKLR